MAKPQAQNSALIWGLRIGLVLGVIAAGDAAISLSGRTLPGVLSYLEYLLFLTGVLVAGLWTAEETGRMETSALAGLLASLPYALILNGALLIQAFVAPAAYAAAIIWQGSSVSAIRGMALTGGLVGILVIVAPGALLALLGGWVGRHRYRQRLH